MLCPPPNTSRFENAVHTDYPKHQCRHACLDCKVPTQHGTTPTSGNLQASHEARKHRKGANRNSKAVKLRVSGIGKPENVGGIDCLFTAYEQVLKRTQLQAFGAVGTSAAPDRDHNHDVGCNVCFGTSVQASGLSVMRTACSRCNLRCCGTVGDTEFTRRMIDRLCWQEWF